MRVRRDQLRLVGPSRGINNCVRHRQFAINTQRSGGQRNRLREGHHSPPQSLRQKNIRLGPARSKKENLKNFVETYLFLHAGRSCLGKTRLRIQQQSVLHRVPCFAHIPLFLKGLG